MSQLFTAIPWLLLVVSFLIAFVTVWWIHPILVRLALSKQIVDNPDARKLQRTPVPLLGGVVVFFGIICGMGCLMPFYDTASLVLLQMVMSVMLYIGTIDDVMDLSPGIRFLVEIICVLLLVFIGNLGIVDFHGLWGITHIPMWFAAPLTIFISVGIINAINLIDGVDGLSSGFCVMACVIFGLYFYRHGNLTMAILASTCAGGLIPFFMHNVFGKSSRMFIGDGGTLVMGMVMSIFVMSVLADTPFSVALAADGMGLIAFVMAVLSIPVFDTVRVMSMRMLRGTSPFRPDKTHLHHLFIDLGFSHAGTTFSILMSDSLVVLAWYLAYRSGLSIDVQLYLVILLGLTFTFGFYFLVSRMKREHPIYRLLRRIGILSHIERKGFYSWLQRVVDRV